MESDTEKEVKKLHKELTKMKKVMKKEVQNIKDIGRDMQSTCNEAFRGLDNIESIVDFNVHLLRL